jgi:cyanate permease
MALSLTQSLLAFYVFFCIARMNFAGPFDIGIYGALNTWFVARRPLANGIVNLAQMAGLAAMPLIAHAAMAGYGAGHGWRAGWLAVGATVLVVGFVPCWLFLIRRPEDVGLVPDGRPPAAPAAGEQAGSGAPAPSAQPEPTFSRAEAMRTPAFWLLSLYTVAIFPVQAGVSLHQAPHLVERGLSPTTAALIVSCFSLMSGVAALACGFLPRRLPARYPLALAGMLLAFGAFLMVEVGSPARGYAAAALFGLGIGGVLTLLPVAWADYFGRANFGAIRGLALSAQVVAQACGPLLSGALRDLTGNYALSLYCFAGLSLLSMAAALAARRPTAAGGRS